MAWLWAHTPSPIIRTAMLTGVQWPHELHVNLHQHPICTPRLQEGTSATSPSSPLWAKSSWQDNCPEAWEGFPCGPRGPRAEVTAPKCLLTCSAVPAGNLSSLQQALQPFHFSQGGCISDSVLQGNMELPQTSGCSANTLEIPLGTLPIPKVGGSQQPNGLQSGQQIRELSVSQQIRGLCVCLSFTHFGIWFNPCTLQFPPAWPRYLNGLHISRGGPPFLLVRQQTSPRIKPGKDRERSSCHILAQETASLLLSKSFESEGTSVVSFLC